jgi:hypothetical protein
LNLTRTHHSARSAGGQLAVLDLWNQRSIALLGFVILIMPRDLT